MAEANTNFQSWSGAFCIKPYCPKHIYHPEVEIDEKHIALRVHIYIYIYIRFLKYGAITPIAPSEKHHDISYMYIWNVIVCWSDGTTGVISPYLINRVLVVRYFYTGMTKRKKCMTIYNNESHLYIQIISIFVLLSSIIELYYCEDVCSLTVEGLLVVFEWCDGFGPFWHIYLLRFSTKNHYD